MSAVGVPSAAAASTVSGPILPRYMSTITVNFPGKDSEPVIPAESPAVPKADTASNMVRKMVPSTTIVVPNSRIENALSTVFVGTEL